MGSYRLMEVAKEDLRRIYYYGVSHFGEAQADKYFDALFERFSQIAENPFTRPWIISAPDIGVVCAEWTVFSTESWIIQ